MPNSPASLQPHEHQDWPLARNVVHMHDAGRCQDGGWGTGDGWWRCNRRRGSCWPVAGPRLLPHSRRDVALARVRSPTSGNGTRGLGARRRAGGVPRAGLGSASPRLRLRPATPPPNARGQAGSWGAGGQCGRSRGVVDGIRSCRAHSTRTNRAGATAAAWRAPWPSASRAPSDN